MKIGIVRHYKVVDDTTNYWINRGDTFYKPENGKVYIYEKDGDEHGNH